MIDHAENALRQAMYYLAGSQTDKLDISVELESIVIAIHAEAYDMALSIAENALAFIAANPTSADADAVETLRAYVEILAA